MSARERTKQKVKQRLLGKLENLNSQEQALHTLVKEFVDKAKVATHTICDIDDAGRFLEEYSHVEQMLDRVYNVCELLTTSAEDMIEESGPNVSMSFVSASVRDKSPDVGHVRVFGDLSTIQKTMPADPASRDCPATGNTSLPQAKPDLKGQAETQPNTDQASVSAYTSSSGNTDQELDPSIDQSYAAPVADTHEVTNKQSPIAHSENKQSLQNAAAIQLQHIHTGYTDSAAKTVETQSVDTGDLSGGDTCIMQPSGVQSQPATEVRSQSGGKGKKKKKKQNKSVPIPVKKQLNKHTSAQETESRALSKADDTIQKQQAEQSEQCKEETFDLSKPLVTSSPKKQRREQTVSAESTKPGKHKSSDSSEITRQTLSGADGTGQASSSNNCGSTTTSGKCERHEAGPSAGAHHTNDKQSDSYYQEVVGPFSSNKDNNGNNVLRIDNPVLTTLDDQQNIVSSSPDVQQSKTSIISAVGSMTDKGSTPGECGPPSPSPSLEPAPCVLVPGTLLAGRITPVFVSEVVSPWCFFVQQNGPGLTALMEQIGLYMVQRGLSEAPILTPSVGSVCLARYSLDNNFYRAYVVKTHSQGDVVSHVDVLYVDYGNRERVAVDQLRRLPPEFTALPAQAICCALAEVMPVNKYGMWTESNIHVFRQYVSNQQLHCTVTCRCGDPNMPIVQLVVNYPLPALPQASLYINQISVGQLLVSARAAKPVEISQQVSLLASSGEGREEAAILTRNMTPILSLPHIPGNKAQQSTGQEGHGQSGMKQGQQVACPGQSSTAHIHIEGTSKSGRPSGCTMSDNQRSAHRQELDKSVNSAGDNAQDAIGDVSLDSPQEQWGDSPDKSKHKYTRSRDSQRERGSGDSRKAGPVQSRSDNLSPMSLSSETESQQDEIKVIAGGRGVAAGKQLADKARVGEGAEKSSRDPGRSQAVSSQSDPLADIQEVEAGAENLDRTYQEKCGDTASTGTAGTSLSDLNLGDVNLNDLTFDLTDDLLNPAGQEVMLAHVKSPGEFYVHVISQQSAHTLDGLMKALNSVFERTNRRKLANLSKSFEPTVGQLCCAQFTHDDNFYRGVVLSLTPKNQIVKGRVLVHYIDFGDEEWLARRRIYPLPAAFSALPGLALRCSLAYIKPVPPATANSTDSGGGDSMRTSSSWSQQSIQLFKTLGGTEKTLHMHTVHGSLADLKDSGVQGERSSLNVFLVDRTGPEEVCINMDLIREGVADLDPAQQARHSDHGVSGGPGALTASESGDLAQWNPMEEDFLSRRNTYNLDTDDVGVATVGYKASDENICRFFSMGKNCWRGDRCPYKHVQTLSGVTQDQAEVYGMSSGHQLTPSPGSWVAVEVATIISPSQFYIILPMGVTSLSDLNSAASSKSLHPGVFEDDSGETLDDLLEAINTAYSQNKPSSNSPYLRALGEIVVARFSQDQQWYRARIVGVTEDRMKVFYVDFGNSEWLNEREVCDIRPEFLHLPFQAIECVLSSVQPTGKTWTKQDNMCFRQLVDGKTLVAHIKSGSWNGRLHVELYDTSDETTDVNVADTLTENGHALTMETDTSCNTSVSGQSNDSRENQREILIPG